MKRRACPATPEVQCVDTQSTGDQPRKRCRDEAPKGLCGAHASHVLVSLNRWTTKMRAEARKLIEFVINNMGIATLIA